MNKKHLFSFATLVAFVFLLTACGGGNKPHGTLVDPSTVGNLYTAGDTQTIKVPIIGAKEYDKTYKGCNDSMKTVKRTKAVKDTLNIKLPFASQGKPFDLKGHLDANGLQIVKVGDVNTAEAKAKTVDTTAVNATSSTASTETEDVDDTGSSAWDTFCDLMKGIGLVILGIVLFILALLLAIWLISKAWNILKPSFDKPNPGATQQVQDKPVVQQSTTAANNSTAAAPVAEQQPKQRIELLGLGKRHANTPIPEVVKTTIVESSKTVTNWEKNAAGEEKSLKTKDWNRSTTHEYKQ